MAVLNQQIAQYQIELQQVGANKKTLQAAINSLNLQKSKVQTQITLPKPRSKQQLQIQQLGGQITSAQQTIATDQAALGAYLRSLQKADANAYHANALFRRPRADMDDLNQTLQIQNASRTRYRRWGNKKPNWPPRNRLGAKTKHSDGSTAVAHRAAAVAPFNGTIQTQLLAETNSQEATYEKLLAAATAELNSFSAFAANAGGQNCSATRPSAIRGDLLQPADSAWAAFRSTARATHGSRRMPRERHGDGAHPLRL